MGSKDERNDFSTTASRVSVAKGGGLVAVGSGGVSTGDKVRLLQVCASLDTPRALSHCPPCTCVDNDDTIFLVNS